jgi:hypothetical protein
MRKQTWVSKVTTWRLLMRKQVSREKMEDDGKWNQLDGIRMKARSQ